MIKIKLIKNKLYQISGISVRRIIHYKTDHRKYIAFHNFRLRKYNYYSTYSYNNGGGGNNNNNSFFIILLFGLYYSYKK